VLLTTDANAIFQALLGRESLAIETGKLELATTTATLNEVAEHFAAVAERSSVDPPARGG
jgi:hypothetical protein